jgi:glycosyltransferase involved in cell wall biosynthesis
LPNTRVISHGVPRYSSSDNGAPSPNGAEKPYFAYVGRLVSEKGLPVLLRACAILAEQGLPFHLKIVGDGPEREHLEALTAELGLRSHVEFPGAIPVEQIPRLLRGAIAVIIPSIWEEVAPLVAYEQLMHGRLAIVSDIGGLGEIVDGVGLKFPPGDAQALADCMRWAAEEPGFAADVRKRAQQRAQEAFTLERMVENHLGVYKELAGAGTRQG